MTITLSARPPFSFRSTVMSHGWMQLAPFGFDERTGLLAYIDRLSSGRVLEYRIREAPGGVRVEAGRGLSAPERAEVKGRIAWMLGLDMDFSGFYRVACREPKLSRAEKKAQGRVLRCPTLFEDAVKTILTTNTLWGATRRMTANLVAQFGEALPEMIPGGRSRRRSAWPERLRYGSDARPVWATALRTFWSWPGRSPRVPWTWRC